MIASAKAGAIEPGVANGVAARAASALLLLSLKKDNGATIVAKDGVAKLIAALQRDVQEAAGALMNLALHSAETQNAILSGGALPQLVGMLSAGTPAGQEEAAGALMNLVSNAPQHQKTVADAGAVLPLVMLLSFGSTPAAKEQAAAALGNLALKNDAIRKSVVSAQACPALLEMLKGTAKAEEKGAKKVDKTKGKKTGGSAVEAANCLRVLLEGDTTLQAQVVEDGMLPLAAKMLSDKVMAEAATRLLSCLDDCFDDMIASAKAGA